MTASTNNAEILVLIAIYNDWDVVSILLDRIDAILTAAGTPVQVLLVNDGSSQDCPAGFLEGRAFKMISTLSVLDLGRNLGNQRALAVGLSTVAIIEPAPACVVVMDGDGEDDPSDIVKLVAAYRQSSPHITVFARRTKRSEGLAFRLFYALYQVVYRVLTGQRMAMGNFSVLPISSVRKLVLNSELWNHYSAAFMKSRIPWKSIDTLRARRIAGESKMNFTSLVIHAINALSVHADTVGVRSIVATIGLMAVGGAAIVVLVGIRLFTTMAIPGWTSNVVFSILTILFQAFVSALLLAFIVLGARSSVAMTPARHFEQFIQKKRKIF